MSSVKAIRIHSTGGPDVMRLEKITVGAPGPGEALVVHTAIGLNFIDVYHRSGLYPMPLPAVLGVEAVGVVQAIGPGVGEVGVGERVAYAGPIGAYAEARLVRADRLVPLPPDIDDRTAAGMMLAGLTAQYLVRRTYRVKPGDVILVHAAAGGVGLILCQWASAQGATVIGTVGAEAKVELARRHGCAHVVLYTREDFVTRVREVTGGKGVSVVYDSVGADTFERSLDCLAPLGLMVSFGNASGPVPPISPLLLATKGSLFLTRPTLGTYTAKREDLLLAAGDLFDAVRTGLVRIEVRQAFALAEAAKAHRELEARRTTGSTVLLP